ncbi:unnamed protein product [Schistosoma rodhaini]|nr:unnamed protein product [Schistosoma rodhaini]
MSQSFSSSSSSSTITSLTLSSYTSIYGYVQCISRIFLIKDKHTAFIKITSHSNCFYHSIYNIIIQWNVITNEEKYLKFLLNCPINSWIRIHNLKESRIYYKQNRESKVWLFIPDQTYIETLPHPRILSNCNHECCLPQLFPPSSSSSSSSSTSFPVGLIPSIDLSLISSHCNGIFLEFERTNPNYHQRVNQHYLLLNIDKVIQSIDKLLYRQTIKLFNVWSFYIGDNNDYYDKKSKQCIDLYALLIPGIYSSSSSSSSSIIDIDDKSSNISYSRPTVQCPSVCFNFNEQLTKKNFSLLLHNLNYLFNFCLAYQINGLLQHKEVIHFKENIFRNQDCTLSESFQRLLSNLFIQSRNINFKSYQYAEDFIQFPFISNVQENHQSFNFVKDNIIDLHDIITWLQSSKKSYNLNKDSEEICTLSTTDQCFKCIYTSHYTQFIPSKSSSSLLTTTTNYLWHVQVCETRLQIQLHHNQFQQYHHLLKRSTPISSMMTETSLKNHSESSLYVIGKILWNNTHGCFYLQTVHNNDTTTTTTNNNNNNKKDNTIFIPLIFNMNTSDEINILYLPSDYSLILLKGVQVIYEEEENPVEVITSENCVDMPFHSTDSVSSISRMYIYAKQIIPFQVNYLSESIMDGYGKTQEQQQSCTIVLVNLGPLSCCSPEASVDPTERSSSSNKLLWSYVFAGKFIENNTVAIGNADTTTAFNNGSSIDSNLMHLSLTGDLAYRWYYNFQIGYHYQLVWVNIDNSTSFTNDQSPLRQLINVSILNNSTLINRENLSLVNVANLNDIIHEGSKYPIGCLLNFEAIILFKQCCSLNGDCILWVTTCNELPKSLSNFNDIDITTVYKVNLSRKIKSVNNLDLISLFTTSNQTILYCRFTNFSLSEIIPRSSSSSLTSLHLNYTDLSHIIIVNQMNTDSMLNKISTQLSDSLMISLDNEYDNSPIVTKEPKLLISNNYDWIGRSISTGYSNIEGDLFKEHINVQATITRCLEFQIYRLSNNTGDDQNDDFVNLGICIRFVITDGSGSALVQLGHPFIMPSSSSSGVPCQILSNNDSSSTSPEDNLELARLLLGLNCLIWKRLCCQWKRLLDQGVDLSFNFYEVTNDSTTSECNTLSFSSSSASFSSEVTSNNKYNLIPIKLALKTYLNSPTFLRNCRFTLKYRTKNTPRCHRSTTTSTSSLSNSADHWRLKQINLKDSDNSLYSHDNHLGQQQSVYFVLPPYKLYTLINVTSHDDYFNEL